MSRNAKLALLYLSVAAPFVPLVLGGALLVLSPKSPLAVFAGCGLIGLSLLLVIVSIAVTVWAVRATWTGQSGGSTIRVRNTVFHEQIFVDEQLIAEHRGLAFAVDLSGTATIAGHPAKVIAILSGFFTMNCRCYVDGAEVVMAELEA